MSWLDTLTKEMIARLPPPAFAPSLTFNFEQVSRAIAIVEDGIARYAEAVTEANNAAVEEAMRKPLERDFIKEPLFGPMMLNLLEAGMTFPIILRRSLLISIYSHAEHALRSWCEFLKEEWSLERRTDKLDRLGGESTQALYMRYLRDEAKLPLNDFQDWPEWKQLDGYRNARNCLAHNGGAVTTATQRKQIEELPKIMVDDSTLLMQYPVVHVLPGGCEAAAEICKSFFGRLAEVCQEDPRAKSSARVGPSRAKSVSDG